MAYTLDLDPVVRAAVKAMPPNVLEAFAQALDVLRLVPERGKPLNKDNPDGGVYQLPFAKDGLITYLLLEDQQRVDLLRVVWLDLG
jgi:hypothetical protein